MKTSNPVQSYFGSEFPAICNHCGVMSDYSRKTLKRREKFLRFFGKTTPVTLSKFCSESFHRDIDRRVVFKFREIWPPGNRWNRALLIWQKQISPGSSAVATMRIMPEICQGQPLTMNSECSRFYPNRFTFGEVITERFNSAKTRRKVNPSRVRLRAE